MPLVNSGTLIYSLPARHLIPYPILDSGAQVLENDRQPIPDVPAVYFVRATEESVLRIADDAARGLYDSMHLNFTPALPRALMERLAAATVASNSAQRISKVRHLPPRSSFAEGFPP